MSQNDNERMQHWDSISTAFIPKVTRIRKSSIQYYFVLIRRFYSSKTRGMTTRKIAK